MMTDVPTDEAFPWEVRWKLPTEVDGYPIRYSREDDLYVAVAEGLPGGAADTERPEDLADAITEVVRLLTRNRVHVRLEKVSPGLDANAARFIKPPD